MRYRRRHGAGRQGAGRPRHARAYFAAVAAALSPLARTGTVYADSLIAGALLAFSSSTVSALPSTVARARGRQVAPPLGIHCRRTPLLRTPRRFWSLKSPMRHWSSSCSSLASSPGPPRDRRIGSVCRRITLGWHMSLKPNSSPLKPNSSRRPCHRISESAAVEVPIGLEEEFEGLVDLVELKALKFEGGSGQEVVASDVPSNMQDLVMEKRRELIEVVSEVDDQLAEAFLSDEPISADELKAAIRRATIARKFIPVYMGSAFKNKGVQPLLNGVLDYLPCPLEVENQALDQNNSEEKVLLSGTPAGPLVALAFKLEEGRFGQLTYLRIYEGVIRKGDFIHNVNTGKKIKVPRLVRMHSNEMEDIQEAHAGQIVAVFGVDCASGDTFTDGSVKYTMTSMHVAEPVMSLAVNPISKDSGGQFSKALNRFQREDPTFRVGLDPESGQTIISGMGELHLDIYVERIRREYKVDAKVGKPRVNFRETVTQRAEFDYLHKKQSGGQGQYGRVCGYIEPLPSDSEVKFEFENMIIGQAIPSNFIPAIEKGFKEACNSGSLIGHPVENIRITLTDGASHAVDSSELAFKLAAIYAFRQCYTTAKPVILEPVMKVEMKVPTEFQGTVTGDINKRKGIIVGNDQEGDDTVVVCHVPLNNMFGYSTALRSMTQGKGEFTMEYMEHNTVSQDVQMQLVNAHKATKSAE